jgi:hypothetical protein
MKGNAFCGKKGAGQETGVIFLFGLQKSLLTEAFPKLTEFWEMLYTIHITSCGK